MGDIKSGFPEDIPERTLMLQVRACIQVIKSFNHRPGLMLEQPLDYDTLRALDSDTASSTPSMTDEEINALPIQCSYI
ncbi:hypothetical protein E2542_SST28664 [Spatholobus suberectus]|nr:hypothetical protein E2542_SST28664 [Spatholobus suberectus]